MILDVMILGVEPLRTDRHRCAGTVTVDGVPASRLVVIQDRLTFAIIAARLSDPTTGAWEIQGLPEYPVGSLLVFALDNSGTYNADEADYVSQVTGEGI